MVRGMIKPKFSEERKLEVYEKLEKANERRKKISIWQSY